MVAAVEIVPVTASPPAPRSVLLVVKETDQGLIFAADAAVRDRLVAMGLVVTTVKALDSTTAQTASKSLVVISASVSSVDVNTPGNTQPLSGDDLARRRRYYGVLTRWTPPHPPELPHPEVPPTNEPRSGGPVLVGAFHTSLVVRAVPDLDHLVALPKDRTACWALHRIAPSIEAHKKDSGQGSHLSQWGPIRASSLRDGNLRSSYPSSSQVPRCESSPTPRTA